jgi:uncharacterized protein (DUF433 family)
MDWSGCDLIEVVPGKVSGVPLIRGTRLPADQVIDSFDGGETIEEIAYNYDLNPSDVLHILQFRDSKRALARQ